MSSHLLNTREEVQDNMEEFADITIEDVIEDSNDIYDEGKFVKQADTNAKLSRKVQTVNDYGRRWNRYKAFIKEQYSVAISKSGMSLEAFALDRNRDTTSYVRAWICKECDFISEKDSNGILLGCLGKSVIIV
jgi:hypothetical protein